MCTVADLGWQYLLPQVPIWHIPPVMNNDGKEGKRAVSYSMLTTWKLRDPPVFRRPMVPRKQPPGELEVKVACVRGQGFTDYHDMHGKGNDNFLLIKIPISGKSIICLYLHTLSSRLGKPWGAIKVTEVMSALRF